MIEELFSAQLLDYIAMDIKAPLEADAYVRSTGIKTPQILEKVEQSIELIMNSGIEYEFRTTVVPTLHTEKDIERIAKYIKGARKYALQNFSAEGEILSPAFAKIKPYPIEILHTMKKLVSPYVEECVMRGG